MSEREFNEIVAERIRYYLDKYEITQAELAKRLGVGSTSVYNWLPELDANHPQKRGKTAQIRHFWKRGMEIICPILHISAPFLPHGWSCLPSRFFANFFNFFLKTC